LQTALALKSESKDDECYGDFFANSLLVIRPNCLFSLTRPVHERKILCRGSNTLISNCRVAMRQSGSGNPIGRGVIELSLSK
jgi:hypothetical protein